MILFGASYTTTAVEEYSLLITVCSDNHGQTADAVKQTLYPRPTGFLASTHRVLCSHAAWSSHPRCQRGAGLGEG